jgi:hypothetical protein
MEYLSKYIAGHNPLVKWLYAWHVVIGFQISAIR